MAVSWRAGALVAGSATLAACAGLAPRPQEPGRLQRASAKIVESRTDDRDRGAGQRVRHDDGEDDDEGMLGDLFGDVFGPVFARVIGSPLWVPHALMERRPGELEWASFASHPYFDTDTAWLSPFDAGFAAARQMHSVRTTFDYGTDFEDLERFGVAVHVETAVRLGLEGSWSHFREQLPAGATDTLNLGDANVTYRFAQADYGEMRAGLGVNWSGDGGSRDAGLNLTYAGDFFPARPLVVSFEVDAGSVGNARRFHGRATVGCVVDRFELLAGFDYESIDAVSLPMWTLGVRVFF